MSEEGFGNLSITLPAGPAGALRPSIADRLLTPRSARNEYHISTGCATRYVLRVARTKRYRRGWDDGRNLGLQLLIFHVAGAIFFLWFLGAPLSVSEWRESEGFVSYNWLFWSCRYPGLLLSGLGVLVSLPLLLWPGALSLPSRTKRRRQLAGGTQPEPSGSS